MGINETTMESASALVPETFTCEDCGEQYRGFKFYALHLKDEHGKEAEYGSATRAKAAFTIIAGKPRQDREEAKAAGFLPDDYQVTNKWHRLTFFKNQMLLRAHALKMARAENFRARARACSLANLILVQYEMSKISASLHFVNKFFGKG